MSRDTLIADAQPLVAQWQADQEAAQREAEAAAAQREVALWQTMHGLVGDAHVDLLQQAQVKTASPYTIVVIDLLAHGFGEIEVALTCSLTGWKPVGETVFRVPRCYDVTIQPRASVVAGKRFLTNSLVEAVAMAMMAGPSRQAAIQSADEWNADIGFALEDEATHDSRFVTD